MGLLSVVDPAILRPYQITGVMKMWEKELSNKKYEFETNLMRIQELYSQIKGIERENKELAADIEACENLIIINRGKR